MSIHKVFISYHHDDQEEVDAFINKFDTERNGFIARGLGINMADDIIDSSDTNYVMRKIRENYLRDSTVTLVLIGKNTWARRYVDWEIQASLRQGKDILPNGLIGIRLRESNKQPERLALNRVKGPNDDYYARLYDLPQSVTQLKGWIDDAYDSRWSRSQLIVNPTARFLYNKSTS